MTPQQKEDIAEATRKANAYRNLGLEDNAIRSALTAEHFAAAVVRQVMGEPQ